MNLQKQIERALKGFDPASISGERKDAQLNIRLGVNEKASIESLCAVLGVSAGEYLLTLHRVAAVKLQGKG